MAKLSKEDIKKTDWYRMNDLRIDHFAGNSTLSIHLTDDFQVFSNVDQLIKEVDGRKYNYLSVHQDSKTKKPYLVFF